MKRIILSVLFLFGLCSAAGNALALDIADVQVKNRTRETTTTTGTGSVALGGTSTGYQTWAAAFPSGAANVPYTIYDQSTGDWENGFGTFTTGPDTLARTLVTSNSSHTEPSKISFGAGTKYVAVNVNAEILALITSGINQLTGDVTAGPGYGSKAATIANSAVTYAKIQDVSATDKILGRSSLGAGVVQEITCTSFARSILDDANAAAVRTTIGAGTGSGDMLAATYDPATIAEQLVGLTATQTLTNKTLTSAIVGTKMTFPNNGLYLLDTNASHSLIIAPGSDLTSNRTLTITTGDSDRTLTISGNTTISGTNTGDQTITLTGDVTATGTGSMAATIPNDTVTYAKIQNVSAASKLLGRGGSGGAGDPEEITLGTGLSMSGTTLLSSSGEISVLKPYVRVMKTSNTALTGSAGTVDAIATANGDLILLTGQTSTAENGPWVINTGGAWARPSWYTAGSTTQAFAGVTIPVFAGDSLGGRAYSISTTGTITIDTTGTTWVRNFQSNCPASSLLGNTTGSATAPVGITVSTGITLATNTLKLSTIADQRVMANISGGVAAPVANTLSDVIDTCIGSTRGQVLYRGASGWAALSPGTSGYVLTSNGAGADPSYQAAASSGSSGFLTAYKTADQSITSSTTLTADSHLSVTVEAKVYSVYIHYSMSNAAAVGGFKVDLNGGSATVTGIELQGWGMNQSTGGFTTSQPRWTSTTLTTTWSGSGSVNYDLVITGVVEFSGTGTFIPKIAQSTSDAGASVFRKYSYMRLHKMN